MTATQADAPEPPAYRLTRSALVRGLGLIYAAAFASLAVQVVGLIGRRGILPAEDFLDRARQAVGPSAYRLLPTVFWLDASDLAMRAVCWGGVLLGLIVAAGYAPRVGLGLLWVGYLSLTVVGQEFLGYQWDSLLLEAGLLGLILAPGGWRLADASDGSRVGVWLFRWLVFRLMFLSGVVKLRSGDPTWAAWDALRYHYETQPIPTWTSWYAHQLPSNIQRASVGFMFAAELVAPLLIIGPRPLRRLAFLVLVALQVGILVTGNYGFFNLLSALLCVALLDDRDLRRLRRVLPDRPPAVADPTGRRAGVAKARRYALGVVAAVVVLATGAGFVAAVVPRAPVPWPVEALREVLEPLRSFNTYGLFAVMTTDRPEVEVEGTDDGQTWKPYRFDWKAGEPSRRPRFCTPHLPRLDWQMWFAALGGDCRGQSWFLALERRLLEGSPEVLALLRENPFPTRPPKAVRARLWLYRFTRPGQPGWWTRTEVGTFCPEVGLEELRGVGP